MQTAWSILALALFVTDGPPVDQPRPPGPRFTIMFRISDPFTQPSPKTSVETPEPYTSTQPVEAVESHEIWLLSLPEAIHVALDNSDFIHVVGEGEPLAAQTYPLAEGLPATSAPMVIAKVKPDAEVGRFRADAIALVRSVEQQYWNLLVAHVHLSSAELAVEMAEEVIGKETAELMDCGRGGSCLEVAEAAEHLEQFRLDVTREASSVIDAERRLRAIMGLPSSDNRRIVPSTEPIDQRIVFGAKSSLKKEIRAQRKNERNTETRPAIQSSRHSPAQLFLEVNADYKSYKKARKMANADAKRLDIQSRAYQKGRITAGRFLDFIRQFASSAAAAAECLATYNIALAAFGETTGSLLDYRDIVVAEGPHRPETWHAAMGTRDDAATTTSFETDAAADLEVPHIEAIPASEARSFSHAAGAKVFEINAKPVVFSISLGGFIPLPIGWELRFGNDARTAPERH